MLLQELQKRPSFANLAGDEDVLRHIGELEDAAGKVPTLTNRVTELETKLQGYEIAKAAAREAEITALLVTVKEPLREKYRALFNSDFETTKELFASMQPSRRATDVIQDDLVETSPWDKRMNEIENKLKK